jgi:DNA-binding protein HU-beta
VNKSQLIDALAARFEGNRKAAAHALESVLDTITREVAKGEKVAITGFGSFEKRVREARMVRNPQTGDRIKAKKKSVPKFTAGADLKNVVSGAKKLPSLTVAAASPTAKKATATAKKTTSAAKKAAKKATKKATKSTTKTAARTPERRDREASEGGRAAPAARTPRRPRKEGARA